MVEKVLTKKSFIGRGGAGRLGLPGEQVDVDEKGAIYTAGSTPVSNMSDEQLEAELKRRKRESSGKSAPVFGGNVADPGEADIGTQRLEIARFRPGDGTRPQGIPPGTEEHNNRFLRPAPADSPAAVEEVLGTGADPRLTDDGETATGSPEERVKAGGSEDSGEKALSRQNKAELLATARAHGVDAGDEDTNAALIEKIEKARNAS